MGSRCPGDGALLVDLDGLIEELRVEILDLFHGHVVLFHQRHDLFARDVTPLLTELQKILNVHDGANVLLDVNRRRVFATCAPVTQSLPPVTPF